MGMGPMTGRGAGLCAGTRTPGFFGRVFGRGLMRGRGRGGGRGWRNMFHATGLPFWARGASEPTAAEEKALLKDQADWLQEQREAIQKRMDELDKS
jgi:hypothetical protein